MPTVEESCEGGICRGTPRGPAKGGTGGGAILDLAPDEDRDDRDRAPGIRKARTHLAFVPLSALEQDYPGHLFLLKAGGQEGIPLDRPVVRVGRGNMNDFVVASQRISRRHLVIAAIGQHLVAINCQEPDRVQLNGRPLTQARLCLGDQIDLPGLSLILSQASGRPRHFGYPLFDMSAGRDLSRSQVIMGDVLATESDDQPARPETAGNWAITCYRRQMRGATYVFADGAEKTMGCGPDCDLPMREVGASQRHVRFVPRADGLRVEVLPGSPAISVNGVATQAATLQRGDTFGVGDARFVVHLRPA